LIAGLAIAGCGSDKGSPPADTGTSSDVGSDAKTDAAPSADVPAADKPATADLPAVTDVNLPDAPAAVDSPAPLDVANADVAIDSSGSADLKPALDTARLEVSAVDLAGLESGSGEAGSAVTYVAALSGAQEVPPVATTATGSATFTLSADRTQLTYSVTHTVTGGTASHIHLAGAGENGAVIYPFTPFGSTMTGTLTITATDADNLEQGKMYVNVHSSTNPGGEIRGQILHPGDSLWVATLTGSQESPPVTSTGTGTAAVILGAAKTSLRYHVNTTGLTLTNAHIHKAVATIAGGVIHPFSPIAAVMDGTIALSGTDAQDLADGLWYVNVHTVANPGGELRGQLMLPGEVLYSASLSGASEVPPVTTSATGGAQFILNTTGTSLRYQAAFTGLTATASHIHTGASGVNGNVLYPLTLTASGAAGTQPITAGDVTNLNAGNFYINAHTAANPNGEIRGQIGKP
jgi:hypothetical protein